MDPEAAQLVFGDDGSASADVVWLWINNHPWPGWRISVVSAQPPPPGTHVDDDRSSVHPWTPPAPRRLFAAEDVTQVEHLMAEADPRLVLDSFTSAALLAIGPRGRGAIRSLIFGSTAEWLVSSHRPLTPLVVVRSARRTEHVLLCVDGSIHAQHAVEALTRLPWIGDTRVTLLGVEDGRAEAERGVTAAAEVLEAHGVSRVSRVLMGALPHTAVFDVRSTILDVIGEETPDLVAMGTRGLGGLRRVLGSTARAVIDHAPCSVLIARSGD